MEIDVSDFGLSSKCENTTHIIVDDITDYNVVRNVLNFFKTGKLETVADIAKQCRILVEFAPYDKTVDSFCKEIKNSVFSLDDAINCFKNCQTDDIWSNTVLHNAFYVPEDKLKKMAHATIKTVTTFTLAKFADAEKVLNGPDINDFLRLPLYGVVAWLMNVRYTDYSNDMLLLVNHWVVANGAQYTRAELGLLKKFFPYSRLSDVFLEQVTAHIEWAKLDPRELHALRSTVKFMAVGHDNDHYLYVKDEGVCSLGEAGGNFEFSSVKWHDDGHVASNFVKSVPYNGDGSEMYICVSGFNIKVHYCDEHLVGDFWINLTPTEKFVPQVALIYADINNVSYHFWDGKIIFPVSYEDDTDDMDEMDKPPTSLGFGIPV